MNTLQWIENKYGTKKKLNFKSGDQVRIHVKIKEGEKERIQIFEGIVIKIHRGGLRTSFTVRKVSYGVGVERVFPLHSPAVDKIEMVQSGRVRRSKLYYLRRLSGRKARIGFLEREFGGSPKTQEEAGLSAEPVSAAG